MKDKKYKYLEDLLEDYLSLTEEQIETRAMIEKVKEKFNSLGLGQNGTVLKPGDAQDAFKIFMQLRKYEERQTELIESVSELEELVKEFFEFVNGSKVSYEKKDEGKSKVNYLFWLEEGTIKYNR